MQYTFEPTCKDTVLPNKTTKNKKPVERGQYRDKGTVRCHIRTLSGVCRTRAPLGVILGHCQVFKDKGTIKCHIEIMSVVCNIRPPVGVILGHCQVS